MASLAIPFPPYGADLSAYPTSFPVANRVPYAIGVDMGVVRSDFAAGNARQRRQYRIMPQALALAFQVRVDELNVWQNWINAHAYEWFLCPVSTMYSAPATIRYEALRFTGDLQMSSIGWNLVEVTVAAELAPDAIANDPGFGAAGWIVGGSPAAPSSPDWIAGGTPSAPAGDTFTAGTPSLPAGF